MNKSPLIDLNTLQQQGNKAEDLSRRERLSEGTLANRPVENIYKKRCDSPSPDVILRVIELWKSGLAWKRIAIKANIPERTARRYLANLGYKRDYSFVSQALKGKTKSEEHRQKVSITRKLKEVAKGERNPNWKGGIDGRFNKIYRSEEYKTWRKSIFERDGYICRGCGAKKHLEAHHILPRRDFPHLIFELRNGITLCETCHTATVNKEYQSANIWKQRV